MFYKGEANEWIEERNISNGHEDLRLAAVVCVRNAKPSLIHSLLHSVNDYRLNTYCALHIVVGAGAVTVNKSVKSHHPRQRG